MTGKTAGGHPIAELAARSATLKACADIVRKHYAKAPRLKTKR